jgi:hypothetical protein
LRARDSYQPVGKSLPGATYESVFVRRVHRLIAMGYSTLTPCEFAPAQEEEITGELVKAIDGVLNREAAPVWSSWFSVHEEPRVHDPHRRGKRRLRLDIRIDCSQVKPRSRLCFEAKRLGPGHGTADYVGSEGLQCFIEGSYARNETIAGMLGYVQGGTPEEWAVKIEKAVTMAASSAKNQVPRLWRQHPLVPELQYTYYSSHERPGIGSMIDVYHTLLVFN